MKHYICTGECGGVSDTPGTCQAGECSLQGQPLVECTCRDGKHIQLQTKGEKNEGRGK